MNTRTLIALATFAVAASAGNAFAQEASSDAWMNVVSTKTTAQVAAELKQARADGSIKAVSAGYMPAVVNQKSRDEVRAEVLAAARSGELARIGAEAYSFDGQIVAAPLRLAKAAR